MEQGVKCNTLKNYNILRKGIGKKSLGPRVRQRVLRLEDKHIIHTKINGELDCIKIKKITTLQNFLLRR
jgi:hypothetical protein